MNKVFVGLAIAALLSACATQAPLYKETQSGRAEATMEGVTLDEMRNEIILGCTRNGMEVESGTNAVTCGKREEGGRGFAAQMLIGNAYSGTPYTKVKFTFAQTGNDVFVVAEPWLEIGMGFGETKRIPITNVAMRNDLQKGLDTAAANARARRNQEAP